MHEQCASCGLKYEREPGFFLGSIYFNYGVTATLVVILYFTCYFGELISPPYLLWTVAAFSAAFPVWFFRYARSLWLGMDQFLDPRQKLPEEENK